MRGGGHRLHGVEPVDAYTLRITVRARCAETAADWRAGVSAR